jgi:hypothetical protein
MSKAGGISRARAMFAIVAGMLYMFNPYSKGPGSKAKAKATTGGRPGYKPARSRRGPGHGGSISRRKMQRHMEARKHAAPPDFRSVTEKAREYGVSVAEAVEATRELGQALQKGLPSAQQAAERLAREAQHAHS